MRRIAVAAIVAALAALAVSSVPAAGTVEYQVVIAHTHTKHHTLACLDKLGSKYTFEEEMTTPPTTEVVLKQEFFRKKFARKALKAAEDLVMERNAEKACKSDPPGPQIESDEPAD